MLRRLVLGVMLIVPLPVLATDGWLTDPSNGCKVFLLNIAVGATVRWAGPCVGGNVSGRGVLEYLVGGKVVTRNEGDFKNGKLDGRALVVSGGDRLEGEFRDGLPNGRVVRILPDGTRFDGAYKDGSPNGYGVLTSPSGGRYEGEWVDGKRSGRGIYTSPDGARYEGEWRDGILNGRGTFTFPDGDRYDGEFKNGKPEGVGSYRGRAADGSVGVWTGQWRAGCYNSNGRTATVLTTRAECGFN